jgi:hypothetical protein
MMDFNKELKSIRDIKNKADKAKAKLAKEKEKAAKQNRINKEKEQ